MGERNFGFDSLEYMNCNMEEKGIVAHDCLPPESRCPPLAATRHHHRKAPPPGSGQPAAGSRQWAAGSARVSLLQIDVEVEELETSENPTQSFVIHNIVWRRTQLLAVIICII